MKVLHIRCVLVLKLTAVYLGDEPDLNCTKLNNTVAIFHPDLWDLYGVLAYDYQHKFMAWGINKNSKPR